MIPILLQQGFNALQRGDAVQAASLFEAVLKMDAAQADALHLLGMARLEQGRVGEAVAFIERAVQRQPGNPMMLCNLGLARRAAGQPEAAIEAYRAGIALAPDYAPLHFNLGNALGDLLQYEAAVEAFAEAGRLDPQDAEAPWNEGLLRLALGDLERGLPLYEWGWRCGKRDRFCVSEAPQLQAGDELAGRTVLVWAEQGLGDTIQFCRYVPLLAARGARVLLHCQPALERLLGGLEGLAAIVPRGHALPPHDFQSPIMTLPLVFGSTLQNLPPLPRGLYASAPPALPPGRRVGFAWSGNMAQQDDARRSMSLATCLPLLTSAPAGTSFISVQKEIRATDAAALAQLPPAFAAHVPGDMADTAGLMQELDLVISVCTSVAHLAASLGRPVWLLLPYRADWRWFMDRDDSPWYPGLRIFRQTRPGDWAGVLAQVSAALQTR